ncbi:MAG: ImmA/IrrE family metallo-endopeptidase [Oscillospiraceae bacterium]|nr:ImmA/IrrE family metallo-endopeptidase [Oscillospiraceae bacterium]
MKAFDTPYSFSMIPYTTYDSLDDYAGELVKDFAPNALGTPSALDVDKFVEFYLHLDVDYRHLCVGSNILGITAFNDGTVEVLNEQTLLAEKIPVSTGTVIISPTLLAKRNIPRLRFTMMHEGSHWLLHRKAFAEDNPFGPAGKYENQFIAAKEGRVDYSRSMKENTDIARMERQADFLASAILMNRPALRIAFKDFFKFYNDKPRRIIRGASYQDDCYAQQLPEYVAKAFGVSKRAALIRLEKLTAIVNKGSRR